MVQTLRIISAARRHDPQIAAAIPGIHIEGPYISAEDGPRGAHDPAYIRDPDVIEFKQWQEAADGKIALVTIAPERRGALDFIRQVVACGVATAIGHTAADPATIRQAIMAGARLSTHLGNGSHGQIPRLNNYLWEQLAADELMASIIADGFHLPASVLKVISPRKGLDKLILVSDVALLGVLFQESINGATLMSRCLKMDIGSARYRIPGRSRSFTRLGSRSFHEHYGYDLASHSLCVPRIPPNFSTPQNIWENSPSEHRPTSCCSFSSRR
jgi:hypothetical protein